MTDSQTLTKKLWGSMKGDASRRRWRMTAGEVPNKRRAKRVLRAIKTEGFRPKPAIVPAGSSAGRLSKGAWQAEAKPSDYCELRGGAKFAKELRSERGFSFLSDFLTVKKKDTVFFFTRKSAKQMKARVGGLSFDARSAFYAFPEGIKP